MPPPLCLYCYLEVNGDVPNSSDDDGLFGSMARLIDIQRYKTTDDIILEYSFLDVKTGMYFSNDTSGKGCAWRIKEITRVFINGVEDSYSMLILLEDVNKYNRATTETPFGLGRPAPDAPGYIFELNLLGLPILSATSIDPYPKFTTESKREGVSNPTITE